MLSKKTTPEATAWENEICKPMVATLGALPAFSVVKPPGKSEINPWVLNVYTTS